MIADAFFASLTAPPWGIVLAALVLATPAVVLAARKVRRG